MQIFARLTKVDEASRTVSGVIASEAVDRSGEVFDYESSKPLFEAWSGDVAKATGGKSVGNVRAMHGNIAAGKLSAMHMDDAAKAITVDAKIVDDNEWNKVTEGVYTGFSIGGQYARKWRDGDVNRYTAQPHEVSLVDLPCNPDAMFSVIKADGSQEMRKFAVSIGDAEALAKWVDGLSGENRVALSKSLGMSLGVYTQLSAEQMDAVVKAEQAKIAERKDVSPKEGEHKYGDVTFADEKNKKYPINTPAHIRAAWNYINKPKNAAKYDARDLRSIKSKIVAAWKDKIDKAGPPSARKDKPAEKAAYFDCVASMLIEKQASELIAKAAGELVGKPLEKGLYTVSCLADLLERLDCIANDTKFEAEIEGDGSALPAELRDAATNLSEILVHMVAEEVEEMNAGHDVEVMELAAHGDLAKSIEETKMNDELQKAHDEAKAELAKVSGELATANESLTKVAAERDELAKGVAARDEALTKAAERIEAQAALIEKLKAEPEPIKGAMRVVSKGQDIGNPDAKEIEPVLKADGSVDEVRTALKKALSEPVMVR